MQCPYCQPLTVTVGSATFSGLLCRPPGSQWGFTCDAPVFLALFPAGELHSFGVYGTNTERLNKQQQVQAVIAHIVATLSE